MEAFRWRPRSVPPCWIISPRCPKPRLVAENHKPAARGAGVAARHDICPSLSHG